MLKIICSPYKLKSSYSVQLGLLRSKLVHSVNLCSLQSILVLLCLKLIIFVVCLFKFTSKIKLFFSWFLGWKVWNFIIFWLNFLFSSKNIQRNYTLEIRNMSPITVIKMINTQKSYSVYISSIRFILSSLV